MKKHIITYFIATFAITAPLFASSSDGEPTSVSKTFTVSKGGTLEVSTNGGDIRITAWTKNEASVRVRGIEDDEEDSDQLSIKQAGNTIRIESWGSFEGARFEISIPTEFNIDLHTSVGTIDIKGGLTGRLEATTSAGDIRLGNVGGEIDMRTSGGDIRTGKIDGTATLKTSGGNITVESSTGALDIHTSGGEIVIGNVGKSLRASTSGGNIELSDVGGDADLSTSGGNITAGKITGKASLKTAGGDVELHGANGAITAKTSGGNVLLEQISGSVEAKTAGGDVDVELIPNATGTSRLNSSGGNLKLTLPENSKATIDATIRIQGSGWGRHRTSMDEYTIRSDFKATSLDKDKHEGEIHGHFILNGGGHTITLETVNGDIDIRKQRGE